MIAILIALYWTACFGVALVYAVRALRQTLEDRDELIAEKLNGPALIEANATIRRAAIRIGVSVVMFVAGLMGLSQGTSTAERIGVLVGFIGFASVYALQGFLDDADRKRTIDLLKR